MSDQPPTTEQVDNWESRASKEGYAHHALVALDIFTNVLTGGKEDETISSRVRRVSDARSKWSWNPGVWLAKSLNAGLNVIQPNHGQRAQAGDLERAESVEQTENSALGRDQ